MAEAAPSAERLINSEIYKVIWKNCIPNDENSRNKIETEAIAFDEAYCHLQYPLEVDFNRPEAKSAYFYRYFTWTVYAVSACWKHFNSEAKHTLECWFNTLSSTDLHVVSVGGGPASDVVGLCQWLYYTRRENQRVRVECTLVDKYDWFAETRDLLAEFDICLKYDMLNPNYTNCDFFDADFDAVTKKALEDVNIITFVNFFGTIVCEEEDTEKRLKEVLLSLPVNTMIMFMDSANNAFASSLFITAVEECQLMFVSGITDMQIEVPGFEKSRMDSHHLPDVMPQTVQIVNACLLLKPTPSSSTENGQPK